MKREQKGQNGRAHLQQQGVDADDARLWDGWQEIVFDSEGKVRRGSVRTSEGPASLQVVPSQVLSPLALWDDAERDDQHGADPQPRHKDLDQEFTCH